MAHKIKLEVYTISLREKNTSDLVNLHDFNSTDFYNIFKDFVLTHQSSLEKVKMHDKVIRFKPEEVFFNEGSISGIIESGDYGYESDIHNLSSQTVTYSKTKNEAEIKPFYFMLYLPSSEINKAFLVTQRFGGLGINTILKEKFFTYLKEFFQDYSLDFKQFVSKKLALKIIKEGRISELTLTRNDLPPEIEDRLNSNSSHENKIKIQIKLLAGRNSSINLGDRAIRFINNPSARFFEIEELGFDGDHEAKIKVKHNGATRTIDLSDSGQIRPYHDIDSEVKKKDSGHPEFDSINGISLKLIKDLLKEE